MEQTAQKTNMFEKQGANRSTRTVVLEEKRANRSKGTRVAHRVSQKQGQTARVFRVFEKQGASQGTRLFETQQGDRSKRE